MFGKLVTDGARNMKQYLVIKLMYQIQIRIKNLILVLVNYCNYYIGKRINYFFLNKE